MLVKVSQPSAVQIYGRDLTWLSGRLGVVPPGEAYRSGWDHLSLNAIIKQLSVWLSLKLQDLPGSLAGCRVLLSGS